jgi:hypothetical protein
MHRVLELVDDRFGGAAAWLAAHGLDEVDGQRLEHRLAPDKLVSRD